MKFFVMILFATFVLPMSFAGYEFQAKQFIGRASEKELSAISVDLTLLNMGGFAGSDPFIESGLPNGVIDSFASAYEVSGPLIEKGFRKNIPAIVTQAIGSNRKRFAGHWATVTDVNTQTLAIIRGMIVAEQRRWVVAKGSRDERALHESEVYLDLYYRLQLLHEEFQDAVDAAI